MWKGVVNLNMDKRLFNRVISYAKNVCNFDTGVFDRSGRMRATENGRITDSGHDPEKRIGLSTPSELTRF